MRILHSVHFEAHRALEPKHAPLCIEDVRVQHLTVAVVVDAVVVRIVRPDDAEFTWTCIADRTRVVQVYA